MARFPVPWRGHIKRITLLAAAALAAATAPAALVINEVDCDTPGTDTLDFVELHNTGPGSIDFSSTSYQVVFFNGGTTSPVDGSYLTANLTSGTVSAGSYVIIGTSGITGSVAADVEVTVSDNTIQNGSDAIGLYAGTPYGVGASPTTTDLVDAIVYDTGDADDAVRFPCATDSSRPAESGAPPTVLLQRLGPECEGGS